MNLSEFGFIISISTAIVFFLFSSQYIPTKKKTNKKGYSHPPWMQKFYNTPQKRLVIYRISAISRIILPIILFSILHPCNAMILNQIIVDNIDPLFLVNINSPHYNRELYQNWDKFFDLWGYFVSLFPVFTFYRHDFSKYHSSIPYILVFLFIYRVIGYVIWKYYIQNENLFIYFPDFYTSLYYAISLCLVFQITNKYLITFIIFLLFFLKIIHEIWNHYHHYKI